MPLYEYQCDACGHAFEVIQKFSDAPIETCPKCGGTVHKLMSSPAIQFKGTGWYVTDYAKKDGGAAAKEHPAAKEASADTKGAKDSKKEGTDSSTSSPATPKAS